VTSYDIAAGFVLVLVLSGIGGRYLARDIRVRLDRERWREMKRRDARLLGESSDDWADRILK
jgi:hypothetical protein